MVALVLILFLLFSSAGILKAQGLASPFVDSVSVPRWLFVSYDNDAHFKTDFYYTQGIRAEYYSNLLQDKGITKILLKWPGSRSRSGIILVNDAFTPVQIESAEIQQGDHPFAGYFYAGLIQRSVQVEKGLLFTSEIDLGVMGPWSGAKAAQTQLHNWLGDPIPHGWKNQIAHDVVLNYNLRLEKRLLEKKNLAGLYGISGIRAGTLYNDLSAGFTLCLGNTEAFRNNVYVPEKLSRSAHRNLKGYFIATSEGKAIGYNGTLQGGIFNEKHCAYTLKANDINRLITKSCIGIGVTFRATMLEYDLFRESPEFSGAKWHNFSRLKGGIRF